MFGILHDSGTLPGEQTRFPLGESLTISLKFALQFASPGNYTDEIKTDAQLVHNYTKPSNLSRSL